MSGLPVVCANCQREYDPLASVEGACSRVCALQLEYAQQLADVVPISVARGRKRRRVQSSGPTAA
jgi:hypothetical protein